MQKLLQFLLENLVAHADEIAIEHEVDNDIQRFNVTLNVEDYSRVIGKRGLTIKALTDILKLYEAKNSPESHTRIFINTQA
ncbi:KH domain-containing protein [Candidatus Woesebacteria bacterium]|nr:KH domain-containing protein [Candidatus Woesebacteria bacterium]